MKEENVEENDKRVTTTVKEPWCRELEIKWVLACVRRLIYEG